MRVRPVVLLVSLVIAGPAFAGWLEDTVTNAMKNVTERGINDAANGAYESGKDAVTGDSPEPLKKKRRRPPQEEASDESDDEADEESDE